MNSKYVSIGKILNFQGIKGEVKLGYTKGQEDFISSLTSVLIKSENNYLPFNIEQIRFHKGFAIIKFKEFNSINEILQYKGCLVFVDKNTVRENLDENEFLIDELIGLKVYNTKEKEVGVVVGVTNNGASDLLSIRGKSQKISLVPFVLCMIAFGLNLIFSVIAIDFIKK